VDDVIDASNLIIADIFRVKQRFRCLEGIHAKIWKNKSLLKRNFRNGMTRRHFIGRFPAFTKKKFALLAVFFPLIVIISLLRPACAAQNISAIWANTGEDKVTRDELRAARGADVKNSVWDGSKISIFGGRNETVAFNIVLEAATKAAGNITVSFNQLKGPGSLAIASSPATGNGVFDWRGRSIELFFVRYLQIKGLSKPSYGHYDERLIPRRMRRPLEIGGRAAGTWMNRPDHDKFYPDIAVPLELVPHFDIAAGSNQSIWVDVYIPKSAPPGNYFGNILVRENGSRVANIPVQLKVYPFTLPDAPSAKTMLYFSAANINHRYLGSAYVDPASAAGAKAALIRDRHYMLAHRHRLSMIGDAPADCGSTKDEPCPESIPRLDGSLFTAANGYEGPGVGVGNNVYAVGPYGSWGWNAGGQDAMHQHTDAWSSWFARHSPTTEYFLYLIDESTNTAQIEMWSRWILNNPGPGREMRSMATIPLPTAASHAPSLDIPTSTLGVAITSQWQPLAEAYTSDARKRLFMYNGSRPASGSTAIEDDGIALRELAWGQFKKHINRWFLWETTYYNNYQGGTGETNVFKTAQTFGGNKSVDPVSGKTGWNYSNGEGILFYPGTDRLYPADSYGVEGPFASLRLKHWRRGIQDVDYLTMASRIDPEAVQSIVKRIIPKVLWEYGVDSLSDPTYARTDISWSSNPDVWENARVQLANLIASGKTSSGLK
jgi:hypothetical protein